jgi:7-cyano-7-deazaguanine reductase
MNIDLLQTSKLGKATTYPNQYDPSWLFPIPRQQGRAALKVPEPKPFAGVDLWNSYEFSWLLSSGKPQMAIVQFCFQDDSTYLLESKSLKLYLNSFSLTRFPNAQAVQKTLEEDLSKAAEGQVSIKFILPDEFSAQGHHEFSGVCLDDLDIAIDSYQLNPDFLCTEATRATETFYTHLFKANCPVTGQPDWASIWIRYSGKKIQHEGLLKYLVSYREQKEFHEQCVERIFMDLVNHCQPEKLSVYGHFCRRGGLDINPFRSNFETAPEKFHLFRQ